MNLGSTRQSDEGRQVPPVALEPEGKRLGEMPPELEWGQ